MTTLQVNGWLTRPAYTISETAKLARTTSATVRRWLYGYESTGHQMKPVFGHESDNKEHPAQVSFLQLAEIVVVSAFRKRDVKLKRLRRAHAYARREFDIEYPFASLALKTDGVHVLLEFERSEQSGPTASHLLSLDEEGQWTLPGDVVQVLEEFDYEPELAVRWFPAGKNVPIVVDPLYAAGRPTIPGRGITIESIYKMWKAGNKIEFIAEDYELDSEIIESALRYADSIAA